MNKLDKPDFTPHSRSHIAQLLLFCTTEQQITEHIHSVVGFSLRAEAQVSYTVVIFP